LQGQLYNSPHFGVLLAVCSLSRPTEIILNSFTSQSYVAPAGLVLILMAQPQAQASNILSGFVIGDEVRGTLLTGIYEIKGIGSRAATSSLAQSRTYSQMLRQLEIFQSGIIRSGRPASQISYRGGGSRDAGASEAAALEVLLELSEVDRNMMYFDHRSETADDGLQKN
jgi:hypothetical protein